METGKPVLELLANGGRISGEILASTLGISRSAVNKQIRSLRKLGCEIDSIKGCGYQWRQPVQLLNSGQVSMFMAAATAKKIYEVIVRWSIGSTNDECLQQLRIGRSPCIAVLAEHQKAGRGRRGRYWQGAVASGLNLSIGYSWQRGAETLEGLSVVVGTVVVRVLRRDFGMGNVNLKWPNDIYCAEKKLGGILIEMQGDMTDQCLVAIGIGVNIALPEAAAYIIDQPYTDILKETKRNISRNELAGRLLTELSVAIEEFLSNGFDVFKEEWNQYDNYKEKYVSVTYPNGIKESGIACGVSDNGALLLRTTGGIKCVRAGEVSLRAG